MTSGGMATVGGDCRPVFAHLIRLSDERGVFEHARHDVPRREHGYCVDDVARALVVVCREPRPDAILRQLARRYLSFVLEALDAGGTCRNRLAVDGRWTDEPALGDWWGRAVWGLGVAAASAGTPGMRARALAGFRIAAQQRSPHIRAMAFAALGAAEVLRQRPDEDAASALARDAIAVIGAPRDDAAWPWPEDRLSYANASIAEALIVAGEALTDSVVVEGGLQLLEFLLGLETRGGHLSVTPAGGRGSDDGEAGYDQQPIEVAAIADACASAYRATLNPRWLSGITLAWAWFLGDNDSATPMFVADTGAGFDGLEAGGRNSNQGAESTLAMLSTAQHARRLSTRG
jgi:hypothetical protein